MSAKTMGLFLYPILGFVIAILAVLIISSLDAAAPISDTLQDAATVMGSMLVIYVLRSSSTTWLRIGAAGEGNPEVESPLTSEAFS
jgi:uncharacterized membrane protein YeaQ/YmgE (transglycosylase-associated protein family)